MHMGPTLLCLGSVKHGEGLCADRIVPTLNAALWVSAPGSVIYQHLRNATILFGEI